MNREKILLLTTLFKYIFSAFIACLTYCTTASPEYVALSLEELFLIILLSDWLVQKFVIPGRILNTIICFLFNTQMLVLLFGNSYIQLVMLTNLTSLRDLGGNSLIYGIGTVSVLIFSGLPVSPLPFSQLKNIFPDSVMSVMTKWKVALAAAVLIIYEVSVTKIGIGYSPIWSYGDLIVQYVDMKEMNNELQNIDASANEFYSSAVTDYRKKDDSLAQKPNVILIFTEGLSQNIIEDSRNIMPNVRSLEENSLSFSNYYNHTFATYRGLSGQLYSGYQMYDQDANYLISIQNIFDYYQYHTVFINTEPANEEFSNYISAMDFDEVVGDTDDQRSGMIESYSDREAYEMLFEKASELRKKNSPFFLCMYTFGTHITLDSTDKKFAEGDDPLLNKFYNDDFWLGEFLDKFNDSKLADNTILIFTSDHSTYADSDFTEAFPDYYRECGMLDVIPFCIYYKGMVPETIDACGKNSLDMAPTILDYLDMTAPNYFLGKSLFCDKYDNIYDTVFNEESTLISTYEGKIENLDQSTEKIIRAKIQRYFVAKLQENTEETKEEAAEMFDSTVTTTLLEDKTHLEIRLSPDTDYEQYWFAVWTTEDGQDDKLVYTAARNEDGTWSVQVDLRNHSLTAELNIHTFGGTDKPEECIDCKTIILQEDDQKTD